jgi:TPR repeat protein
MLENMAITITNSFIKKILTHTSEFLGVNKTDSTISDLFLEVRKWIRKQYADAFELRHNLNPEAQLRLFEWYRTHADNAEDQNKLGILHREGIGCEVDENLYLHYLKLAAENACPETHYQLGWAFDDLAPPDYAQAFVWYMRAAKNKHAGALGCIGSMYYLGDGCSKDEAYGISLMRQAKCRGSYVADCELLGIGLQ